MPLIKFSNKAAEGFYLLATNGEVGSYWREYKSGHGYQYFELRVTN